MFIQPLFRTLTTAFLIASLALGAISAPQAPERVVAQDEAGTPTELVTPEPATETPPASETPAPAEESPTNTATVEPESSAAPTEPALAVPTPSDVTPEPAITELPSETPVPIPTATPSPTATPVPSSTPVLAAAVLTPRIAIAKNAGRVGETLGVSISGFPPLKRVAIRFDGARKVTLTADASGSASGSFRVPAAVAGLHVVSADGSRLYVAKNFRIRPSLSFSYKTVQAGQPVGVTLAGFAANSSTRIRLYEVGSSTVVLSVWVATTDANGGASRTFTTKTTLSAGKHKVIATDASGNTTSAYLTTTAYRPAPPEPDDPRISQVYDRGTSGRREIALTFDAGADRGYAEAILDTLADYGVKATFGMTGTWALENPDLVRRMAAEGHQIINHTWDHPSFTGVSDSGGYVVYSRDARLLQLSNLSDLVASITGGYQVSPYWRPPYGDLDASVLSDVAYGGYTATVMWTCDSLGWAGASTWEIISRCGSSADPGDIILMHVGAQSLDGVALPDLIELLQSRGFALVTVERLLQP